MPFLPERPRIPLLLRIGIWIAERKTGKRMLPARLLAWYPRAALSSGIMEALVAHREGRLSPRLLKLVRMQVSFSASCPFCIDMNSAGWDREGISDREVELLRDGIDLDKGDSPFSPEERAALRYARALSASPIAIPDGLPEELRSLFSPREIAVLASTIGQVNYWTRTIQGLGIPPAGFTEKPQLLTLERFTPRQDSH
jgi:alkylhydroperoxidase family enzyme